LIKWSLHTPHMDQFSLAALTDWFVTLSVGDTHHGNVPLHRLIDYVLAERFDSVIIGFRQAQSHWLLAMGLGDVGWLVGQDTRYTPVDTRPTRTPEAFLVGQTGRWHPRRAPTV
jgi:hypothetical protein